MGGRATAGVPIVGPSGPMVLPGVGRPVGIDADACAVGSAVSRAAVACGNAVGGCGDAVMGAGEAVSMAVGVLPDPACGWLMQAARKRLSIRMTMRPVRLVLEYTRVRSFIAPFLFIIGRMQTALFSLQQSGIFLLRWYLLPAKLAI